MDWHELRNKHAGEVCTIIGNGPSLRDVPLAFLQRYPTIGTNRIYLLEGFTPTYYTAINPLVIEQSIPQINAIQAQAKFIRATMADMIPGSLPLTSGGFGTFSINPSEYVYEGYTVTYVAMQLAYFLGFTTALLVGVDHKYKQDAGSNTETVWQGHDPNHFHPGYFTGTRWNNPDLRQSTAAYELARSAYDANGRKIINLTPNSALDVFEKGDLHQWI